MKHLDLNQIYDKEDEESVELHNTGKLLFGNNFHIIFGQYIFGCDEKGGKLYDSNGNIVKDKVNNVAPLINQLDNKIMAYWIIDENDAEVIRDRYLYSNTIMNYEQDGGVDIEYFFSKEYSIPGTINIIKDTGMIVNYSIVKIGESRIKALKKIADLGLEYKGSIFQPVFENEKINYLICTK